MQSLYSVRGAERAVLAKWGGPRLQAPARRVQARSAATQPSQLEINRDPTELVGNTPMVGARAGALRAAPLLRGRRRSGRSAPDRRTATRLPLECATRGGAAAACMPSCCKRRCRPHPTPPTPPTRGPALRCS
jgi:hypothetical protein